MIQFDSNLEYLLAFVSAIFGLSVPIMLQVIERVDQRYESTRLAERLKSERAIRVSIILLIIALFSCTYTVFCKFPSPWDCWILNNSANLLALISCIALIVSFLCACRVILIYYNPKKLQDRILSSFEKAQNEVSKESDFIDWVDLTKVLLSASDRTPALKVYDVLGKETYGSFEKSGKEGVVFPVYLTRGVTSINENLCQMPRRPFSINNGNQILKNLIAQPSKLTDEAYRLLWNNLQLQLFYDQEDWVYEYWSAAVQKYDLDLVPLYEGMPVSDNPERTVSKEVVNKRFEDRIRFKEFHITLCASILREKRYELLDKLISFYRAMTPEYEYPLVPSSFSEILEAFKLVEESPRFGFGVEGYYPMRGMKGIVDSIVLGSVKRYLAFLFARVFSNIGKTKNTYANYPDTIGALKRMDEVIGYLQWVLPSILRDEDLMNILSFTNFSEARDEMQVVLSEVKSRIEDKEKESRKTKPNEPEIIQDNLEKAKNLVINRLNDYGLFIKKSKDSKDIKTYYLRGNNSFLFPNLAFQRDAGISYVNMADSVACASITEVQHGFATTFYLKQPKLIRISSEKVFDVLKRLEITDDYVIVAFDVYWDYYLYKEVEGFRKEEERYFFNDVPIICLHGGPSQIVSQSLFVMKTNDIPSLSFVAPIADHITQYQLTLLDDSFKLYGSVVKLNENEELLTGVTKMSEEEAREHSLFNLFLNAKMTWNMSAPVLCIKLMYDFKDNGSVDSEKIIIPFDKLFEKV